MRTYTAGVLAQLNDRSAVMCRKLIWASARNLTSGLIENLGFWNGDDDRTFTIEGSARTYVGAGAVLALSNTVQDVGLSVRSIEIDLSPLDASVNYALRGYDLWLAPVEIHEGFFDVDTNNLISEPNRVFKGWLDELPLNEAEENGESTLKFVLASNSRILTQKLDLKKSNESHLAAYAGDDFFQYADVSGAVPWAWGEELIVTSSTSVPVIAPNVLGR